MAENQKLIKLANQALRKISSAIDLITKENSDSNRDK